MANGQRSPIFKPSETLKAVLLSTKTVLPIKSSSALSPPPLQKNPNLKPLAANFDQTDEPPPYRPGEKLLEMRPHPLALPPQKQKAMTPKPPKRFPPHLHWPGPEANTFPLREVVGPEGPTWDHVPF